ncbi:uncharacterized protein [Drosophila takahashii]|uniref:uncharacterized protein n=1 Tax=Drosophila takahashii TaxID=29030 RepID=UPI0038996C09
MSVPPWKKEHNWRWLAHLNGNRPSLKLRHYKRKPAFRPRTLAPKSQPDHVVMSKFEATRGKLMHLLRRFDDVDSIIERSRRRINPFLPLALIELDFADIESELQEGAFLEYDYDKSDDTTDLAKTMDKLNFED